jgi:demethylmenaquinone methyltransferase / 2-methoxy-6-polyprenyl-1,4-benzoquinol methylase
VDVQDSRREPTRFARQLFDGLPARYDLLADVLSFGQNARWRRTMVDALVAAEPRTVLDVATGPAGVALQIEDRTGAWVAGLDVTEAMLRRGVANVERRGRSARIRFVLGRGEELPFPDASFDAVSFTYLLRYVSDPQATIAEMARVTRPGGTVANLEFHVPAGPLWHPLWRLYTRLVLPMAGLVTGGPEWFRVGRFLGPSISAHYRDYPLAWHLKAWREAGIDSVNARLMSVGGGVVMWGTRAAAP